jgi:hypothetical protein
LSIDAIAKELVNPREREKTTNYCALFGLGLANKNLKEFSLHDSMGE